MSSGTATMQPVAAGMAAPGRTADDGTSLSAFYEATCDQLSHKIFQARQTVRRLEEQRYELNRKVTELKGGLQQLLEPASSVGEVIKPMGKDTVLVKISPEGRFVVDLDPSIDISTCTANTRVALYNDSYKLHKVLPAKVDPLVSLMKLEKVPDSTYEMVGGLEEQVKEVKEVIELPVKHPEIFEALGISQPKGVLLYGPPGTGKTLLARAVAHHTDCTFIRVSGSELVQKYIGEGSRMVRELFVLAREHAPSIIFMDEIDSIGSSRIEGQSGDSEVQRTMLELLNQLDGFESRQNIKIIMCTNRIDILDDALLRPGRIDRKIEFPNPSEDARLEILKIHSRKMNLARNIDLRSVASETGGASGAEMRAVCTEAGMFALRERRTHVSAEDFRMAVAKVMKRDSDRDISLRKLFNSLGSSGMLQRIAVVGAGPAGVFTAKHLLRRFTPGTVAIDLFERDVVPGGLIRFGVAADHPELRTAFQKHFRELLSAGPVAFRPTVTADWESRQLSRTADGGAVGSLDDYDAAVFATGAADQTPLFTHASACPSGVVSAVPFSRWMNGAAENPSNDPARAVVSAETARCLNFVEDRCISREVGAQARVPADQGSSSDSDGVRLRAGVSSGATLLVIGFGNVALDVVRVCGKILCNAQPQRDDDLHTLAPAARRAVEMLAFSRAVIVGRGPLGRSKFSPADLREFCAADALYPVIDPAAFAREKSLVPDQRVQKKLMAIFEAAADPARWQRSEALRRERQRVSCRGGSKESALGATLVTTPPLVVEFLPSTVPLGYGADPTTGAVRSLRVRGSGGELRAIDDVGLAVESIGQQAGISLPRPSDQFYRAGWARLAGGNLLRTVADAEAVAAEVERDLSRRCDRDAAGGAARRVDAEDGVVTEDGDVTS